MAGTELEPNQPLERFPVLWKPVEVKGDVTLGPFGLGQAKLAVNQLEADCSSAGSKTAQILLNGRSLAALPGRG